MVQEKSGRLRVPSASTAVMPAVTPTTAFSLSQSSRECVDIEGRKSRTSVCAWVICEIVECLSGCILKASLKPRTNLALVIQVMLFAETRLAVYFLEIVLYSNHIGALPIVTCGSFLGNEWENALPQRFIPGNQQITEHGFQGYRNWKL
jgi:hypothetical protein